MSKKNNVEKMEKLIRKAREEAESFAKMDEEKFIKKQKKEGFYLKKKEIKELYYNRMTDLLPGTIYYLILQGYVRKDDVQELKNRCFKNLINKKFVKYLTKQIEKDEYVENIDYLPVIIKEILGIIEKTNREILAEDPNGKVIECDDIVKLSQTIMKKKIKKMAKRGVDANVAFDMLSIVPNKKILDLYRSSKLFRIKSVFDCLYEHAKTKTIPFSDIVDMIFGRDYYPAIIAFALLERKERFSDLNESQKAFYLQVSTWCFDTLEKELSKNEIVSILETYISTRKRDELNGRDGNRRYALSTLSEDDYPKLKKIINDMIITDESVKKYL